MTSSSDSPAGQAQSGQAMWGGRFSEKPADLMQAINVSIGFDRRLWAQDIAGSKAHAAMLALTAPDGYAIHARAERPVDLPREIAARRALLYLVSVRKVEA